MLYLKNYATLKHHNSNDNVTGMTPLLGKVIPVTVENYYFLIQ